MVILIFPKNITSLFYLWFGFWSYWHYQKQHYGVYVFVKSYFGLRPSNVERALILLAALPAAIAIIPIVIASNGTDAMKSIIVPRTWAFHLVGSLFLASIGIAAVVVAFGKTRNVEGSWTRRFVPALTLIILGSNNWPFFVFHNISIAAAMVTGGHGLQYVIFMLVYAYKQNSGGGSRDSIAWARNSVVGLLAIAVMFLLGIAMWEVMVTWLPTQSPFGYNNASLGGALAIFGVAITGAHYLLDGVLWRLSDSNSRELAFDKYSFLFRSQLAELAHAD